MISGVRTKLVAAVNAAENGVDYSARGARCPFCGEKVKVYCTRPWEEGIRVRFHRCVNGKCVLQSMGTSIKSVQVDG